MFRRKSKVLEMSDPVITSYPIHANVLSVLGNYPNSMQWFYNHYFQLFGGKNQSSGLYIDFCVPMPWKSCPWIKFQLIEKQQIRKIEPLDFIKNCIDDGYYLLLFLDQYYIPGSEVFRRYHFTHDSFIFGYNDKNKTFYLADFYKNSVYGHTKASFSQVKKAFHCQTPEYDHLEGIVLIKPIQHENYIFDLRSLKAQIENYLLAQCGGKSYTDGFRRQIGCDMEFWAYGVDVYGLLSTHLKLYIEGKSPMSLKCFHVLLDHKKMMLLRINFLSEHSLLRQGNYFYEKYEKLYEQCLVLRNKVIKCVIKDNFDDVDTLIQMIDKINDEEQAVLRHMLECFADIPEVCIR